MLVEKIYLEPTKGMPEDRSGGQFGALGNTHLRLGLSGSGLIVHPPRVAL